MAIVYRVENSEGYGPYMRFPNKIASKFNQYAYVNPGPIKDFKEGVFTHEHLFGCQNIKTLKKWFNDELLKDLVLQCGFKIMKYEVKRRVFGKSKLQVIFKKQDVINKMQYGGKGISI